MKLSIITVNYNGAEGLKQTLDSVASQIIPLGFELEHIIVDGGSNDESVNIIRDYEKQLSLSLRLSLKWISEPDKGIYDGMNKGVAMASGEYLYFLNGGDCLAGESSLAQMVEPLDGADIVTGRVNFVENGKKIGESMVVTEKDLSMYHMLLHGINHQSSIISRQLQLVHPYDITFKIGADWKFFVETIVLGNAKVKMTDCIFANFDRTGVSSDLGKVRDERKRMIYTLLPQRVADDYMAVSPHYYEVVRVDWLLCHPFWYKVYRAWTTLGRKLNTDN